MSVRQILPWLLGGVGALGCLAALVVGLGLTNGLGSPAASYGDDPESRTVAQCFPAYNRPPATGPAPPYGMRVEGLEPPYANAPLRIVGDGWPVPKGKVTVGVLPQLQNVAGFGQDPGLMACLAKHHARSIGDVFVVGGHWVWEGNFPTFPGIEKYGPNPTLLAVDQDGRYLLLRVSELGRGLVKPYRLSVLPYPAAAPQVDGPGLPEIMLDQPFRLQGEGLPVPDGPVQIRLNTGNGWTDLGTGTVKKGRIDVAPLHIPSSLESGGSLAVPQNYQLIITDAHNGIIQLLTVPVRPDLSDRGLMERFWQLEQVQSQPIFKQFKFSVPDIGCTPSYSESPPADLAGTAYCTAQIQRVRPADDLPAGFRSAPQPDWRTVVLTMARVENGQSKRGEWRFVLSGDGKLQALRPMGDLPPRN